jgi:hypothetical protein
MSKLKKPAPSETDLLYGLEPVYEPGSDPRLVSLDDTTQIRCPHCAQTQDIRVDVAYGNQRYVEDCQICCGGMELVISVRAGKVASVQALRPEG